MNDSIVGTEVSGYHVQAVLGQGGMGVVYRAEDVALSRTVALKCINRSLTNDESFLRRFRSEARALAQIDSPYIVRVHTLAELEIGLVIVMEYVKGGDLTATIADGGLTWTEALPLIRQVLKALEHAHAADVVHRDIKPHNILLADSATTHGNQVKMTDFGLAKINRSGNRSRTVTEGVYGSLNYMSPEQVEGLGEVDHRSDLYSLGMTIYELLAGRLPFPEDGTTYRVMRTIVEEEVPPLTRFVDEVPPSLIDIIMRSLEKDPDERFQSASAMRNAVDDVAERLLNPSDQPTDVVAAPEGPGSSTGDGSTASRPSGSASVDGRARPTPTGRPAVTTWRTMGIVTILVGILCGAGYVAYNGSLPPLLRSPEKASLPTAETNVPPAIAPLVSVRRAPALEEKIEARVEKGSLIAGSGPTEFFVSPQQCFIFVVDSTSNRVEAVLDTGSVRVNLRSGMAARDWSSKYADHRQIWVALSR